MPIPDLNLLVSLDVLLAEGSVARAARRLRLSPSAMSRTLARLREATGDPLLVRARRRLDPTRLARTFTLRTSDGFVENVGPALLARVRAEAPGVRLRFVQKADKDSA